MTDFVLFKVRSNCSECGESLVLDGPLLTTRCLACDSTLEIPRDSWKRLFEACEAERLPEGKTTSSVLGLASSFPFFYQFGPLWPKCSACDANLGLQDTAPRSEGMIPCACGHATPTFPPPSWLRPLAPHIVQLFNALREGESRTNVEVPRDNRPVSFGCPECGAHLKITMESPRILACEYCKADLFLPDPLWRALHPVRKRAAWYVALR
jgi:predicted RNA-binding Zn-ribbon protein involved in translation (DUF1610 family)